VSSEIRTVAIVPSFRFRRSGERYIITRQGDVVVCGCPAYDFSRARPKTCKHIAVWRAAVAAAERCRDAGHEAAGRWRGQVEPAVCVPCLAVLLAAAAGKVARKYRPKAERALP
jgi:hypothetical protein